MYIFRSSLKLKDGTVIYAKDYGKKAFRIPIGQSLQEASIIQNDKIVPKKNKLKKGV